MSSTTAQFSIVSYTPPQLIQNLQDAQNYQNHARKVYLQALMATANRHYDYTNANLNDALNLQPISFWDWLRNHWSPPAQAQVQAQQQQQV
jgi:hypothetical protein